MGVKEKFSTMAKTRVLVYTDGEDSVERWDLNIKERERTIKNG